MPRGRPPKLMPCFKCPVGTLFKRKELKRKLKMDLCVVHYDEVINGNKTTAWPNCPNCGEEMEATFDWGGSYEKCSVTCLLCNHKVKKALDLFSETALFIYAKPIERFG